MSFSNGRVSVVATDASPREILAEWARLGQVNVTNLDRLAGAPVTLQLTDVAETQALETLLRGTAGYIAAPRRNPTSTISRYDRILLMPGVAPAVAPPAPSPEDSSAGMGRGRQGQPAFGRPAGSPFGPVGETPSVNIARPGPYGLATQGSGGPSSAGVEHAPGASTQQPAAPLPTSSQVPGVPVGRAGQWNGVARPGQPTAPPTAVGKPGGQTQTPGGPIKNPE